jgi:hypothetical protein
MGSRHSWFWKEQACVSTYLGKEVMKIAIAKNCTPDLSLSKMLKALSRQVKVPLLFSSIVHETPRNLVARTQQASLHALSGSSLASSQGMLY